MNKKIETDIWAVGILNKKISKFINNKKENNIVWIYPEKSFQFYADPFGIWKDGKLYVFVEALDYRIKKGNIDCFVFNKNLRKIDFHHSLSSNYHLSYPFIISDKDKIYMIPESSKSGKTFIYEPVSFPDKWQKVKEIMKNVPMIDPSIIKFNNKWWVFYSLPGPNGRAMKELNVAYTDSLLNQWSEHPKNPVMVGIENSRPGGTPFLHNNCLHLPVQDCKKTYGRQINLLKIEKLTEKDFEAKKVDTIKPNFHKMYSDGLHTLSECENITLIDCKKHEYSTKRKWINWQRRLGRFFPLILKI